MTTSNAARVTLLLTATLLAACAGEPRSTPARSAPPRVVQRIAAPEHRVVSRDEPRTPPRDSSPAPSSTPAPPTALTPDTPTTITLDGDTRDWPTTTVAMSDAQHAYFRFMVADQRYTLQSADHTTTILLDTDNNTATGKKVSLGSDTLGVDLEVQFSPQGDNGKLQRGTSIFTHNGSAARASAYDWDFACTPTFASDWYEARISRTPRGDVQCPSQGLLSSGTTRGAVATLDASGTPDAWSPVFSFDNTPAQDETAATVAIPGKPSGGVRVVSYNVLKSSPNAKPQVFQRILGALQPDIVLVQEWESRSESEIADWFNSMIPSDTGPWHVVAIADTVQNGGGVAVVSRFPLRAALDARPTVPAGSTNAGKPIRAAVAIADAPTGPIILSSAHLKSGGSAGSTEDVRRVEEARALNAIVTAKSPKGAWRIIAGDMNLVGSREPLDTLVSQLDNDRSDLAPAPTRTLGDATYLTWSEAGNAFTPGRLDWLLYSDSNARAANAFVLDTSRLSDVTLSRAGLTATDTADATDHLPVVVDLVGVE